jgi:Protein of unknown function (DUF1549)/Protein of unknown function (DUF1553)
MTAPPRALAATLAVSLASLLVLPARAGAPDPSESRQEARPAQLGVDEEGSDFLEAVPSAPRGDCPMPGPVDLDGVQHRRKVARVTGLFAPSHPSALAGGTQIVGDGGLGGVVTHVRHANFVDDEILGKMEAGGVPSAPLASDAEFLRRVTLDLTGRIPDAATVTSFLDDRSSDKRARQIDALLASDAFVDRWTLFLDDLYRTTAFADSGRLGVAGRNLLHAYFVTSIRSHKPYDVMVRELITGVGDNYQVATANFPLRNLQNNGPIQDSDDNLAATTGSVFLGANALFCTSCHNGSGHLDAINLWGSGVRRQDFWGMSAFFARTTYHAVNAMGGNYEFLVGENATGDYRLNTTTGNKTVRDGSWTTPTGLTTITPTFLLTGGKPMAGEGYRAAMARMVTAHPQFARATVNYLWKELFVLGIVDPADSFDLARQDPASPPPSPWTIQPTHPNLLVRLGAEFESGGYDLRSILRLITTSNSYQLSSFYPGTWSDAYAPYFARHYVRRLGAEMVVDAITKATNVTINLPVAGYASPVPWAVQLPDTSEPQARSPASVAAVRSFLDTFLRGDRNTDPRSYEGSISQSLSSMNDATVVTNRIKSSTAGSAVNKLIAAGATPQAIVTSLYLSTLSRLPAVSENTAALALFSAPNANKTSVAEDLQYVLLNKLDFLFNY